MPWRANSQTPPLNKREKIKPWWIGCRQCSDIWIVIHPAPICHWIFKARRFKCAFGNICCLFRQARPDPTVLLPKRSDSQRPIALSHVPAPPTESRPSSPAIASCMPMEPQASTAGDEKERLRCWRMRLRRLTRTPHNRPAWPYA